MHVCQVQQLYHVVQVDQRHQKLLAQSFEPIEPIFICGHQHIDCLVRGLESRQLVRIDELQKFLECWQVYVLHRDHRLLGLSHAHRKHILKEAAPARQDTPVAPNFGIANHKRHVRELAALEQGQHLSRKRRLWHLNSYVEHPHVVEAQLTVIASEHVQLPLDDIGRVAAARPWPVVAGRDLVPVICLYVEHVHIVHPVHTVVASEVINFAVHQTASRADAGTWL